MPVHDFRLAQLPAEIDRPAIEHGREVDQPLGTVLGLDAQLTQFVDVFLQTLRIFLDLLLDLLKFLGVEISAAFRSRPACSTVSRSRRSMTSRDSSARSFTMARTNGKAALACSAVNSLRPSNGLAR